MIFLNETLATALYVTVDDMVIANPNLIPQRPEIGIAPSLSDAELVTMSVIQALLGYTSEARFIRHAHLELRHLLPAITPTSPTVLATTNASAARPTCSAV